MKFLAVHPSCLMYSKIYLRLEPLGLELVAAAAQRAGHTVRLIDLQCEPHENFLRLVKRWQPDVIAFSVNYLANVPEIIDLACAARGLSPETFICVGGHSVSFIPEEILRHAGGAVDCVVTGEGETAITGLLDALTQSRANLKNVPGCVTLDHRGPPPAFVQSLDDLSPARDLVQHRHKYFIGQLDPAASIEFSRGCPWDCVFCSAWTFYGRNYRVKTPERAVEELAQIREPGIFIVDDVAFIQAEHGMQLGEAIARRGIRKRYYLETRGDVLLRNKEVFRLWKRLGMNTMFLGLEAIDEEGLKRYRKRVTLSKNFEALEFARSLDISVAVNIIADPSWDRERFKVVRDWCLEIPEVVNISINTPYPGTETWHTESRRLTTRDYRLFDIQHTVLPTKLPLPEFYKELVDTQRVLSRKHLGWAALRDCARIVVRQLLRGQTNFIRMLWKFDSVYNPDLQLADHRQPVKYEISLPPPSVATVQRGALYIHENRGRTGRQIDHHTEEFVNATRMGAGD
ncbi:MAG TPA: hopanoid C-3 methylase HpnR [Candidatus Udaeobacter sp.]|nr:hopanoid C-3 methylase HpnR [Candidatus Udaeobacter sp.]